MAIRTDSTSRKLKLPKGRHPKIKNAKERRDYINKIVDLNRQFIKQNLKGFRVGPIAKFRATLKAYLDEGFSVDQAIAIMDRSRTFTSEVEHFQFNAMSGIKKDAATYREFRKAIGYNNKIDHQKLIYDKNEKVYIYMRTDGKKAVVQFGDSPKRTKISVVE